MFRSFISNLISASVYQKSVLLTYILFSIIIILLLQNTSYVFILLVSAFVLNLILLNFLGLRRKREMGEISEVIRKIRINEIKTESDIILNGALHSIEKEIKMMFDKNKTNIDYLTKLEKMRTEFIANTSHELRTPVFAIQGFIETLLNGALEDPTVNKLFLEKAVRHTENLNNLLNDLIDISMIESGEMRMHFRYFYINEFISEIIEEYRPAAEEKNLYLKFTPSAKNLSLFGDKNKLRQAMVNLIENAIKYTEKGGIEVSVEEEQKYGKIIVKDTGIGIAEDKLTRIFERFYRIDKGRSRDVGGTGLGLAIVKHIIEAHNSKIEVKSSINNGSEFYFRLKK